MNYVYIFSYGSLMLKGEAERTLGRSLSHDDIFPATLANHTRSWSAVRDNRKSHHKWLIHRLTGKVPPYVAYLNLEQHLGHDVMGMLLCIQESELAGFDRREVGYLRIDVSVHIQTTRTLKYPVYTYMDQDTEQMDSNVTLSVHYMNLIREVCKKSECVSPGILQNYLTQTPLPNVIIDNLDVVYFNHDFSHLFELRLDREPMKLLVASTLDNQVMKVNPIWKKQVQAFDLSKQDWRSRFISATSYEEGSRDEWSDFRHDTCFLVRLAWYQRQYKQQSIEDILVLLSQEMY